MLAPNQILIQRAVPYSPESKYHLENDNTQTQQNPCQKIGSNVKKEYLLPHIHHSETCSLYVPPNKSIRETYGLVCQLQMALHL